MRKLYALFAGIMLLTGPLANAQCVGLHYRDFMFQDSTVSNLQYGRNFRYNGQLDTLKLDIHFPKGDTTHLRPLIIWAHGGSFVFGDKAGSDVLPLCQDLTKCGYVNASINYRLGIDGVPFPGADSLGATRAVIRAVQDAHAAVRFFRKSFALGNPYRIDTSQIFFGGVSAGAFMALHLAYLDRMSEFPSWCDTTKYGMRGGIQGKSDSLDLGYPSNVRAIINICGALGDSSWMHPGCVPLISFHGDSDKTVPYGTARITVVGSNPLMYVSGSHSLMLRANHIGVLNCFHEYVGEDHIPEVNGPHPQQDYDTTLNETRNFLVHFTCGDLLHCGYEFPMSIHELHAQPQNIHVFPNPASNQLNIDLSEVYGEEATISLFNMMGQELRTYKGIHDSQFTLQREELPPGLYVVHVLVNGKGYVARIVFN